MSDHQSARQPGPALVPPAAPSRERRPVAGPASTTRGWRSRSASSSAAARWTRRATASPAWSPLTNGAHRELRISTSATRPRPTRPFRTPSSKSSVTSRRIARPGRSKSGSRAFSSTGVWIGGRHALAATAGSRRLTTPGRDETRVPFGGVAELDPEAQLLARERRARLAAAIDRLDGRQRTVFMLCHYGDCTPREVSAMTGLNESTVRVHLFRAARKLRALLGAKS